MNNRYVQQFKKGALEMILLALIAEKETYGYEIIAGSTRVAPLFWGTPGKARSTPSYTAWRNPD